MLLIFLLHLSFFKVSDVLFYVLVFFCCKWVGCMDYLGALFIWWMGEYLEDGNMVWKEALLAYFMRGILVERGQKEGKEMAWKMEENPRKWVVWWASKALPLERALGHSSEQGIWSPDPLQNPSLAYGSHVDERRKNGRKDTPMWKSNPETS